jgi:diguanylate cyclase
VVVLEQAVGPACDEPPRPATHGAAIVSIGPRDGADVALADDATEREVLLACRLLAQIARLRRRLAENQRVREQLRDQALTDSLTGLPNRRAWNDELACRFEATAEDGQSLCVALIDLDHFKRVNDRHGHAVGDEVLRVAGQALQDSLRKQDFIARLGGDEFGLLLVGVEPARCGAVVERVRQAIRNRAVPGVEGTASAGFAHVCPSTAAATIVARADEALRQAKRQGRDRSVEA